MLELTQNIALIMGGFSAEREVSLKTGQAFKEALDQLNYKYTIIDAGADLPGKLQKLKPSCALLALHGKYAEDGVVQGICEYLKIPYTGCGVYASALCMHKVAFKKLIMFEGIPSAKFKVVNAKKESLGEVANSFGYPVVVKPSREGSSVGVSICNQEIDFLPALQLAAKHDNLILIEEYIDGIELTTTIGPKDIYPTIEIVPKVDFYDYSNKYTKGNTDYILPARIDKKAQDRVNKISRDIYDICELRGVCRVDFKLNSKNEPKVIEVNTLPGCTETSLVPMAAKEKGVSFAELIDQIISLASLDYENLA